MNRLVLLGNSVRRFCGTDSHFCLNWHSGRRFRSGHPGLNLVTADIVLWNTVYLQRATSALRSHGKSLDDTLSHYLSPLGWEHINLTGDYI
ncbi:Tn3 transposase DDE domain protein [compost metagenome]